MASKTHLLGLEIDSLTTAEFLDRISSFVAAGKPHQIAYLNADCVNKCWRDKEYRDTVAAADLVYADGMGVVWASRLFGRPLPERVNAGDLLPDLCQLSIERGFRLFFLGGEPGIAETAAEKLRQQYPGLQIVGTCHGFMESDEDVLNQIREAKPDILLVGMGAPRQELWIHKYKESLNVSVIWGVGGLLDYCAEKFTRAPVWMRKMGMEWAYRLALEPKRLWKRYLVGNLVFGCRVASLVLVDMVLASIAWLAAYITRDYAWPLFGKPLNELAPYLYALPLIVITWVVICASLDLYRRHLSRTPLEELAAIVKMVGLLLVSSMAISFLLPREFELGRSVTFLTAGYSFLLLTLSRYAWNRIEGAMLREGIGRVRAVIVGTGDMALQLAERLQRHPEKKYELQGFFSDHKEPGTDISGYPVLGSSAVLPDSLTTLGTDEIFFADPSLEKRDLLNLVVACGEQGRVRQFNVVTDMFGVITGQAGFTEVDEVPMKVLRTGGLTSVQRIIKRSIDIAFASAMLLMSLPFLPFIVLGIKLSSPGPVVFQQGRIGLNGDSFTMFKFRTMYVEVNEYAEAPLQPDDPRIIPIGRLLRRTSLDELPQLWNVLKGEMSMVGPRPEMPFIVEQYEPWQRRRFDVKPGITGLWQILGRKDLPLHANLEYDFYYIQNQSILFDLIILIKTVPVVIFGKGAY